MAIAYKDPWKDSFRMKRQFQGAFFFGSENLRINILLHHGFTVLQERSFFVD